MQQVFIVTRHRPTANALSSVHVVVIDNSKAQGIFFMQYTQFVQNFWVQLICDGYFFLIFGLK